MRFLKLSFYTDSVVTHLIASSVLVVFSFAADKFIEKHMLLNYLMLLLLRPKPYKLKKPHPKSKSIKIYSSLSRIDIASKKRMNELML
ncbi:hypothetical protein DES40_1815 [Litorimonas taeanensis]|uniref:Uncharacterized protein n=1 Tax=Litorimonas taeanensis TaxID=568099 RepID=A0A420WDG7_9PROT|nr:hypothetical protein DES40_1815 [Litorimonas taeanensis]